MSDDLQKLCESLNKEKSINDAPKVSYLGAAVIAVALVVILMLASFGVGIWVMISGWGLSPQSWGVIIGGLVIQVVIILAMQFIPKIFKD